MLKIGLTGNIATGKSTISDMFKALGAHTIDTDLLAREVIAPGKPGWKEVIAYFGEDIKLPDNSIDRKKLASIVFSDPETRKVLESILHPHIIDLSENIIKELSKKAITKTDRIVIIEGALLIEAGYHNLMDKLILVTANNEIQAKRLFIRNGFCREEASLRIDSQGNFIKKRALADFIIYNEDSLENLQFKVKNIYNILIDMV